MPRQRAQSVLMDNSGLQSLAEDETRIIHAVFEQLREAGIENEVALPRLVAAGDTSAGKSSVLERLTRLPFPSGEGVVTRSATEVVMRPGEVNSIMVSIVADKSRTAAEKTQLSRFNKSVTTEDQFKKVYRDAARLMGLHPGHNALISDRLRIDISGPKRSPLTVIDLPGLIQPTSATQALQISS